MSEVYYILGGASLGFGHIFKIWNILTIFIHITQGIIWFHLVSVVLWYFPFNVEFSDLWCSLRFGKQISEKNSKLHHILLSVENICWASSLFRLSWGVWFLLRADVVVLKNWQPLISFLICFGWLLGLCWWGCWPAHFYIVDCFAYHFMLDFDTARAVFKRQFGGGLKSTKFIVETSEGIQAFSPDNKDAICVSQVKCWLKLASNYGCLNILSTERWSCCSVEPLRCLQLFIQSGETVLARAIKNVNLAIYWG